MVERLAYVVKELLDETHDVKTLRLAPESGQVLDFKPGQFVNLALETEEEPGKFISKPYSISSSPTNKDYLALTIKIVEREGSFPQRLGRLKPGDRVFLTGPFGVFTFDPAKHKDVVMIAGGVGITPFHSMIRYCTDRKLPNKLTLLFSNKTHEDSIFHREFLEMEKQNPNFKYACTITRKDGSEGWKGQRGRIDAAMIRKCAGPPEGRHFMICGSNAFVQAFKTLLLGMGIPKESVHYELFGSGV